MSERRSLPPAVDTSSHQLKLLARRVRQLGQRRMTQEQFHIDKNDIAGDMVRLADRMREAEGVQPTTSFYRTPADADPKLRRAANDNDLPFFKKPN